VRVSLTVDFEWDDLLSDVAGDGRRLEGTAQVVAPVGQGHVPDVQSVGHHLVPRSWQAKLAMWNCKSENWATLGMLSLDLPGHFGLGVTFNLAPDRRVLVLARILNRRRVQKWNWLCKIIKQFFQLTFFRRNLIKGVICSVKTFDMWALSPREVHCHQQN